MSQNDFNLANQGFPSMRADMNSAFQALASNSSGETAPATTYSYQLWYDTATDILKQRNAGNDGWISVASYNQTTDQWFPFVGATALTATGAELNVLDGVTTTTAQFNSVQQFTGRNLIINGSGRINQRGYASGAATSGANQYTLDRWRVVTSGQNLTFTGNDSARTMTAPAGGVEQVIEGANIVGGTYVISFTGTATCTINGTGRVSGDTFTLTANTNATVRLSSGTFTDVQIELGTIATLFERRTVGDELALCQRYYTAVEAHITATFTGGGQKSGVPVFWPVQMRANPAVTLNGSITAENVASDAIVNIRATGVKYEIISSVSGLSFIDGRILLADAEL